MKLLTTIAILLVSAPIMAEEYQSITSSNYLHQDNSEQYSIHSIYFFDKKSTLGALDQFEYINKTSNIFGSYNYNDFNSLNFKNLSLGGEVFFDKVLIGGTYSYHDIDSELTYFTGSSKNSGTLRLGYLLSDNFIVRATASRVEGSDTYYNFNASYNHQINENDYIGVTLNTNKDFDTKTISSKYFTKLDGDKYFTASLEYTDTDFSDFWTIDTQYYFNKQTSVSVNYNKDDFYGLGVNYFINKNIAVNLGYVSNANSDIPDHKTYSLGFTFQL